MGARDSSSGPAPWLPAYPPPLMYMYEHRERWMGRLSITDAPGNQLLLGLHGRRLQRAKVARDTGLGWGSGCQASPLLAPKMCSCFGPKRPLDLLALFASHTEEEMEVQRGPCERELVLSWDVAYPSWHPVFQVCCPAPLSGLWWYGHLPPPPPTLRSREMP